MSAAQSRERIAAAARLAFTRAGYDTIGVREIAAEAGIDAAMVPRLFGSKELLFTQIAADAFALEPVFEGPSDGLGERVARYLLGPIEPAEPDSFDAFAFLLRSVGSPVAAPILAAALHADFIEALAARLDGPAAAARAAMITAYVLGFAVLRAALGSPALDAAEPAWIVGKLGAAIQACVDV
ncbi:TetR family transcriptional regulator [Burkholderia perseverans]|uniref:TetR/AcrR family transcriptional regulator n=1 Tax=Burkholderia perseverans TaxID=2615214 RepID=UPI001FF049E2|nr:TetR family transcriptional regulator [Burkholderia perseverans]